MNTYLSTAIAAGAAAHSVSPVAATVTVTSVNAVRVHAAPQSTKVFTTSIGSLTPSPNINISSKRARVSSKDKDAKKISDAISGSSGSQKEISIDSGVKDRIFFYVFVSDFQDG